MRNIFDDLIINKNSTQPINLKGKYQAGSILNEVNNLIDYFPSSLKETVENRTWMPTQMKSALSKVSSFITPKTPEEGVKMGMAPIKVGDKYIYISPPMAGMNVPKEQAVKTIGQQVAPKVFKGFKDLTTKVLEKLKGKSITSKQEIMDFTNMPTLKQKEREIIRNVLETYKDKSIPVKEFAEKVKSELLPLKLKGSDLNKLNYQSYYDPAQMLQEGSFTPKWENISLPKGLRGNVANYSEHIWESPIKTSAGQTHFSYTSENYFGHTRIEDMADNIKTRRVIELQSDLYQKGGLETESYSDNTFNNLSLKKQHIEEAIKHPSDIEIEANPNYIRELKNRLEGINEALEQYREPFLKRQQEIAKLSQYNDPTAHFRMAKEEIKQAAKDGKTALQFPTGETAMKIEGLGETDTFILVHNSEPLVNIPGTPLDIGSNIGKEIISENVYGNNNVWVITDNLGEGKFKAMTKENYNNIKDIFKQGQNAKFWGPNSFEDVLGRSNLTETFDISGRVDTSNPIYQFYEKTLGKYLKNNYNASYKVDPQGVSWWEVPIKKSYKGPVEAFSIAPFLLTNRRKKEENKYKLIWQ